MIVSRAKIITETYLLSTFEDNRTKLSALLKGSRPDYLQTSWEHYQFYPGLLEATEVPFVVALRDAQILQPLVHSHVFQSLTVVERARHYRPQSAGKLNALQRRARKTVLPDHFQTFVQLHRCQTLARNEHTGLYLP